jgi:hypothetical protein
MAETRAVPDDEGRLHRARPSASVIVSVDADGTWTVLPGRPRPEDWVTEQAEPAVPGSVSTAESERRPEGGFRFDPAG